MKNSGSIQAEVCQAWQTHGRYKPANRGNLCEGMSNAPSMRRQQPPRYAPVSRIPPVAMTGTNPQASITVFTRPNVEAMVPLAPVGTANRLGVLADVEKEIDTDIVVDSLADEECSNIMTEPISGVNLFVGPDSVSVNTTIYNLGGATLGTVAVPENCEELWGAGVVEPAVVMGTETECQCGNMHNFVVAW